MNPDDDQQALSTTLAGLAAGAPLGTLLPVLGVASIASFNASCRLPIRRESPHARP